MCRTCRFPTPTLTPRSTRHPAHPVGALKRSSSQRAAARGLRRSTADHALTTDQHHDLAARTAPVIACPIRADSHATKLLTAHFWSSVSLTKNSTSSHSRAGQHPIAQPRMIDPMTCTLKQPSKTNKTDADNRLKASAALAGSIAAGV